MIYETTPRVGLKKRANLNSELNILSLFDKYFVQRIFIIVR